MEQLELFDDLARRIRALDSRWHLTRADDGRLWLTGNGAPAVWGSDAACDAWVTAQERTQQKPVEQLVLDLEAA